MAKPSPSGPAGFFCIDLKSEMRVAETFYFESSSKNLESRFLKSHLEVTMIRFKKLMKARKEVLVWSIVFTAFAVFSTGLVAGDAKQGYLGVSIEKLSTVDKDELDVSHGVRVTRVVEESAAERAGIREGDIIQYFNEEKIRIPSDLVEEVRAVPPEKLVKVRLVRDGKKKELSVKMGEYQPKDFWFGARSKRVKPFVWMGKGGYLGVSLQALDKDLASYFGVEPDSGALVLSVAEDTPAQDAGMKSGDVIVRVNDQPVSGPDDVREAISEKEKGDKVELTLVRHKKKKTVTAELDEIPFHKGMHIFKGRRGDFGNLDIPELHFPDARHWKFFPHTIIFGFPHGDCRGHFWSGHVDRLKDKIESMRGKLHTKMKQGVRTISI
jgi:hypothetical protein